MNVVVLHGTLSSPPVARDLPSGDRVVNFEVTARPRVGRADTVPVAWLGAPRRVESMVAGTEVVVTGRVRRRFFRTGGATASRTEVAADVVLPATQAARVARALEAARITIEDAAGCDGT